MTFVLMVGSALKRFLWNQGDSIKILAWRKPLWKGEKVLFIVIYSYAPPPPLRKNISRVEV
jgi:hypothetical protein